MSRGVNEVAHALQAGDIGGTADHGAGRREYSGLWSLTSVHQPHSAFVGSYAGLIFGHHRSENGRQPPVNVERTGPTEVTMQRSMGGLNTKGVYRLTPPNYIDYEVTTEATESIDFPHLSWCCYMNSPEDGDIRFRLDGRWVTGHSPKHGIEATYCPKSLVDIREELNWYPLESLELENGYRKGFHTGYSYQRFDRPFYYGRIRNMAYIVMFDRYHDIRFLISSSGGGISVVPGLTCQAWDWMWLPDSLAVNAPKTLRTRVVYKPYLDDDDVFSEYEKFATHFPSPA